MSAILMKGKTWGERFVKGKLRFEWPVWVEPKVDDIRCRVWVERFANGKVSQIHFDSFANKPLANMHFFAQQFTDYFNERHGLTQLDLGVEVNGNFNDSYRWVRSTKKVPDGLHSAQVLFHLFDLPDYGVEFQHRRHFVTASIGALQNYGLKFATYAGLLCHSEAEVDAAFETLRAAGYEGAMVKTRDHMYEKGKRTFGWYKLKPEDTYDGRITGLVEAVAGVDQPELGIKAGDPLGRTGAVEVVLEDGSVARPHGIAHALGTDMHNNPSKYIGQWVEFAAMERDRQGGYRHPVFRRLREAKQ
jgi:hypothetical protein